MTTEAEFRASLPTDVEWVIAREGSALVATDESNRYPPRRMDVKTGAISSRTSGKLRG
jgi:hypothetical protein